MNVKFLRLNILTMSCVAYILSACSAYDLGASGNYYFDLGKEAIDNPTWDAGVNAIVEKKCATCHTTGNPWYKPKNVPSYANEGNPAFGLEYIKEKAFFDTNNSLLALVKKCIETKESRCGKDNIPMPPNYATPLNDDERKALVNFVNAILPNQTTAGLSAFFVDKCSSCHPQASGYGSAASGNKKIGESRSDTFEKYQATYKSLAPMPSFSKDYSDADALADWKLITGK